MVKPIFNNPLPRFFSVPAGQPFLPTLARAALESVNREPMALAEMEIYLPTRRAMRVLADVFIAEAKNGASLLPRIQSIGALDDDIASLHTSSREMGESVPGNLDLPPAISTMERRLVFAHLTARHNEKFSGSQNWTAALGAARELEGILDSFYTEDILFNALDEITPENIELADHWHVSREFLKIVTHAWPHYLREREMMDPTARRVALIHRAADYWIQLPPQHPVIIAGSTGSTPAVARLMGIAANLPKGCVVLPGLDEALDVGAWQQMEDAHPQAGLSALLKRIEIERAGVPSLSDIKPSSQQYARNELLSLALRPASATDDWLEKISALKPEFWDQSIDGLSLAEAASEDIEAGMIATLIRQGIEEKNDTIMLVTPDRDLSRRVISKLLRWKITVDDSAGIPFSNSERGTFLQLVANWLEDISNPVFLLAVLRHPLCNTNSGEISREHALALLDQVLRGLKPAPGMDGIRAKFDDPFHCEKKIALSPLLDWLEESLAPLYEVKKLGHDLTFTHLLEAHIKVAEALTLEVSKAGDGALEKDHVRVSVLWRGEDGITASQLLYSVLECGHYIDTTDRYADIFSKLISGEAVRRTRATHPRIVILGPLEARLQTAEQVILGGLNEGSWPGEASVDGFLSRGMRAKIGLPSPERRIGLAAHDFSQLAAARRVTLTRSIRSGNAPSKPSRWIVRLKNILKSKNKLPEVDITHKLERYLEALSEPSVVSPIKAPSPRPPIEARPRKMSVTRVEKWLRDPYFIYGRYILGLQKLDRFNEEFGPRYIGSVIHTALETYTKAQLSQKETLSIEEALASLQDNLAREIERTAIPTHLVALWGPAFEKACRWFVKWNHARLQEGHPVVIEKQGKWEFSVDQSPFILEARADRIDLLHDNLTGENGLAIYDYKTGTLPTLNQSKTFSPQLALTGLIASHGGFENVHAQHVARMAFVKTLNRKSDSLDMSDKKSDLLVSLTSVQTELAKALEGLRELIKSFNDPETPYLSQPRPEYSNDYGDYDHLARRKEWAIHQDSGDEGGAS